MEHRSPIDAADHLLLGIADLERGISWFEDRTGVRAMAGGSHPGAGTQNALVGLGARQYLEIIALDPAQPQRGLMATWVGTLEVPRLVTWAVATGSLDEVVEAALAAGLEIDGPRPGSRRHPAGRVLTWRTLHIRSDLGGVIPFFIEWGSDVIHPSEDSPQGCTLTALQLEHPQANRVQKVLAQVGIDAAVERSAKSRIRAVLAAPKATVELY